MAGSFCPAHGYTYTGGKLTETRAQQAQRQARERKHELLQAECDRRLRAERDALRGVLDWQDELNRALLADTGDGDSDG